MGRLRAEIMTDAQIRSKLEELRSLPGETEWIEFKQNYLGPTRHADIGEYISAISNSLVLCERETGYIAWGITNDTHDLVGTDFRPRLLKQGAEELENWLTHNLDPQVRFWFHEADVEEKHFTLLEISSASDCPVRFSGEEYIRVGSLKKKLKDHKEKERELWSKLMHVGEWIGRLGSSSRRRWTTLIPPRFPKRDGVQEQRTKASPGNRFLG